MWYIIQVSAYTALMYGVYLMVLKNKVQYQWSRYFLISSAVIPLLLPFIRLSVFSGYQPTQGIATAAVLPVITIGNTLGNYTASPNWNLLLTVIYCAISLFLLARLIIQYISMRRFIMQHTAEQKDGMYVLYNSDTGPGSWGNYIFLPDSNTDTAIYRHELAHIKLKHSRDILFMRLLGCMLWPDVMLLFITKELKMVHEFQADAAAVQDRSYYTATLLNSVLGTQHFTLSHTFFHHPLKRRINMLHKRSSSGMVRITSLLLSLLMITGIIWLQSCTKKAEAKAAVQSFPEKMPESSVDISDFLSKNIQYPSYARQHNIEGRVIIKFIVAADGSITEPQIIRSPDTSLSRAATEALMKMPKWIPGQDKGKNVPVYFTLPFSFRLDNK